MQPTSLTGRAGLVAAFGALTLAAVIGVLLDMRIKPNWTQFQSPGVTCHADRRTVRHASGAVQGAGAYEPCLIDTGMTTGESGLAISRDGTLLRSVTTHPVGIAVSSDNGATWERRVLPADAPAAIADSVIDPVTDRYFYSGASSPVFGSDDHGVSWQTGVFDADDRNDWNRVFIGRPVTPRAEGYPNNIYYCNWTLPLGIVTSTRCYRSVDGGRHFVTAGPEIYLPEECRNASIPGAAQYGRGVIDPRDGAIYLPVGFCGKVELAVSRDEGATWTRHVVANTDVKGFGSLFDAIRSPAWRRQVVSGRYNLAPAMSTGQFSDALGIDAAGRLYIVWIDSAFRPVLSWSADGGATWSAPAPFQAPGVTQALLPSLAVTPEGRVGISYYGSTDNELTWTGYLTISDNPTAPTPTFETAAVTRDGAPLMPEPCCWASGAQEYTAAHWAPDGSLWAAFAATAPSGDARGVLGRLDRH